MCMDFQQVILDTTLKFAYSKQTTWQASFTHFMFPGIFYTSCSYYRSFIIKTLTGEYISYLPTPLQDFMLLPDYTEGGLSLQQFLLLFF